MSVFVRIPTPLRRLTEGKAEVSIDGATIKYVIENLEVRYSGIKERLVDENGEIRRFINIYVNDEDIRFMQGKDTFLKDDDKISIIPAVAGGNL